MSIAFLLLLSQVPCLGQAAEEPKRILIVDSFGRRAVPSALIVSAFRAELSRRWPDPLDVNEMSLEANRAADPRAEVLLARFLKNRFEQHPIDLVITVGAPATRFVVAHREKRFAGVPILAVNLATRNISPQMRASHVATVGTLLDLPRTVDDILTLLPETRTVHIIIGASPMEQFWKAAGQIALAGYADRVQIDWWDQLSLEEMKSRIAALPPNSVVWYTFFVRDAAGVTVDHDEALAELHRVASASHFRRLCR